MKMTPWKHGAIWTALREMGDVELREFADGIMTSPRPRSKSSASELKRRGMAEQPPRKTCRDPKATLSGFTGMTWNTAIRMRVPVHLGANPPNTHGRPDFAVATQSTEASQRCEMLRRAGIESWVQRPGARYFVAWVDELGVRRHSDQRRSRSTGASSRSHRATHPAGHHRRVKQENEAPAYEIPACPKCGAEDPTLESAEPSNNWLCESCGYTLVRSGRCLPTRPKIQKNKPRKRKEPPGNRAAPSSGRIVPTEAKPSELSGCIVGAGEPECQE